MFDLFLNPVRIGALLPYLQEKWSLSPLKLIAQAAPEAAAGKSPGFDAGDYEIDSGVAQIPVRGGLISAQIPGWRSYAGTTYESLVATIEKAVADPQVGKVLLSINSPGGTVLGCAEAAAKIDALSQKKPIWSCCQMADSAAYWLAAATNKIIVDPTGEVGSIGVIMTHFDISNLLDKVGVKATHLFSGETKADGSPYMALGADAQARLQSDLDHLRSVFVGSVSAFRDMDADDVHATQAMTYKGENAVAAGLADDSAFYAEVLNQMAGRSGSSIVLKTAKTKENTMAKSETAKPADNTGADTGAQAAAAVTAVPQPAQTVDQKTRCASILRHPEAAGGEKLAQALAFESDLSPEQAGKILAAAEKTAAAPQKSPLAAAMEAQGSPQVGANGGASGQENPLQADRKARNEKIKARR